MPWTLKLIHEVERRPKLWKTYQGEASQKSQFAMKLQTNLWKEIAEVLCVSDYKLLKNRWKSLVKNYKEEIKKIIIKRVGQTTTCSYDSTWPYLEAMNFMKNTPTKRSPPRISSPDSPHSKPNTVFNSNEFDSVNHSDLNNHIISDVRSVDDPIISDVRTVEDPVISDVRTVDTPNPIITNVRTIDNPIITNVRTIDNPIISDVRSVDNPIISDVRSVDNHIISNVSGINNHMISDVRTLNCPLAPVTNRANMMLIPNQNHMQVMDNNFSDADFFFLRSLIPDLKSLPAHRKMFVKLKFQEVLYSEIMQLRRESSTAGTIEIFGVSDVNAILP